jgi:hypothetical protein
MERDPRLTRLIIWWFTVWLAGWIQQIFVALVYQYRTNEEIKEFEGLRFFKTVMVKWYVRFPFLLIPKKGPLSIVTTFWQASAVLIGLCHYLIVSPSTTRGEFWRATLFLVIVHLSIFITASYRVAASIASRNQSSEN